MLIADLGGGTTDYTVVRMDAPLYDAVEAAKRRLSDATSISVVLDYPGAELDVTTTRAELEASAARMVERMKRCLDGVLASAGARPEDIEIVYLTGGTSRMPLVEASFRQWLPGASFRRLQSFHSVVRGLARYARTVAP